MRNILLRHICAISLLPLGNSFLPSFKAPYRKREGKQLMWNDSIQQPQQQRLVTRPLFLFLSAITDWVSENLESDDSKITWTSSTMAGENDLLPLAGLCIGKVRILSAGSGKDVYGSMDGESSPLHAIRLLVSRNGWGTGVHPTTRLCLEFISQIISGGETILDYGCGSGVLSIAALHLGASRCIGVDVEAEALVTAERNAILNGFGDGRLELLHTREVLPFEIYPGGVDICVANILIGQLVRSSMVAAITTNVKPGGILCFSGIRIDEVNSLKAAYSDHIDEWLDDIYYDKLKASECAGSIESYGFDCGEWCRLVGRTKWSREVNNILAMSELAVS